MNPQPKSPPFLELARLCAAFHKELSRLVDVVSAAEERLATLELEYLQLIERAGLLPAMQAQAALLGKERSRSQEALKILRDKAAEGVSSLKLIAQAGGAVLAHLDGRAGVRLPPELAALMGVLTEGTGASPDHLVPWRSVETIKEAMLLRTGKKFSKKALHQLIYRLRLLMKARAENHFYVMSDPKLGYRFALRRSSGNVTTPSHS